MGLATASGVAHTGGSQAEEQSGTSRDEERVPAEAARERDRRALASLVDEGAAFGRHRERIPGNHETDRVVVRVKGISSRRLGLRELALIRRAPPNLPGPTKPRSHTLGAAVAASVGHLPPDEERGTMLFDERCSGAWTDYGAATIRSMRHDPLQDRIHI